MNDLGTISVCYTMTFERRSKHPVSRVWDNITDAAHVSEWMGYPARVDLRIGGDWYVDFSGTDEGALDGIIVHIEPQKVLRHTWGLSVIEWTLEPDGDGCRYTFVHHGQTPRDIPDEEGLAAGWHAFLDGLDNHLDGIETDDAESHARWQSLQPAYRERLEAALGEALVVNP